MWGRTKLAASKPTNSRAYPPGARVSTRATPSIATPSVSSIHASLPMLDGQNTRDGQRKISLAYRERSPFGTAVTNAR